MVKTLTAHTLELDDEKAAVAEILEQLDLKNRLQKNSVGIMTCYLEFMETGIVKAVCDALPFPVLGINTLSVAMNDAADQMLLGLTVLTSDDVVFSTALSETLGKEPGGAIRDLYNKAAEGLPDKPSLIMAFTPILMQLGGDTVVEQLDAVSGGIPIFGTLAIDFTTQIRDPRIIFQGETWNDRIGIILFSGNVKAEFSVTSVSNEKILQQRAIITKSAGNVLIEVNDMPVMQYFETLGLAMNGEFFGSASQIPLIVDFNDTIKPVTRTIMVKLPDGKLVCGGAVPVGCSLAVGSIDTEDVLKTTSEAAKKLVMANQDGILLFSCVVRNFALGLDTQAELKTIQNSLGKDRAYMFAYSGGEICPVKTSDGKLKNRFHNVSLISCSFK